VRTSVKLTSLWIFNWRKLLAYTHRWLGIAGCVLFVARFISGVVMMYARMPGLANEERLARAPALDLSTVTLSPAEAARTNGLSADRVHVGMIGTRPVYRFGGRDQTIIYADNGEFFAGINKDQAVAVARRYAPGHTGPLRYLTYLTEPDQWTLQARNAMPMHVFALDDADDTHLYVSEVSGDVELRTTEQERLWGYLGPVLHWGLFHAAPAQWCALERVHHLVVAHRLRDVRHRDRVIDTCRRSILSAAQSPRSAGTR
jgi:hypothetical protein